MCHDKDVCGYVRVCVCEGVMYIMIRMYVLVRKDVCVCV